MKLIKSLALIALRRLAPGLHLHTAGDISHGRIALTPKQDSAIAPRELSVAWTVPSLALGAQALLVAEADNGLPSTHGQRALILDLDGLGVGLVIKVVGWLPRLWPKVSRRYGAGISSSGWLSWHFHDRPTAGNQQPKWQHLGCDIRDLILGYERVSLNPSRSNQQAVLTLPLPGGTADVLLERQVIRIKRPRWPVVKERSHFRVRTGEQGYNQGVRGSSFPASTWEEAIGIVYEGVLKSRGWGELRRQERLVVGRCQVCVGLGFDLSKERHGACIGCNGAGWMKPGETVRQVGRLLAQARNKEEAHRAVCQLASYAARPQLDSMERCRLHYSTAVFAMSIGSPDVALEVLGRFYGEEWKFGAEDLRGIGDSAGHILTVLSNYRPGCHSMPVPEFMLQPLPSGEVIAMPLWPLQRPTEDGAVGRAMTAAEQQALQAWQLQQGLIAITGELERAGMAPGDAPAEYISRMRCERNELQDFVAAAEHCMERMQQLSIPEGGAGDAQRELMRKIGALLSAHRNGEHPRIRGTFVKVETGMTATVTTEGVLSHAAQTVEQIRQRAEEVADTMGAPPAAERAEQVAAESERRGQLTQWGIEQGLIAEQK